MRRGGAGDALHQLGEAGGERGEGAPGELDRRGGALDAEAAHLEGDVVVAAEGLLHGDVLAGRPAGGVHQRHLELGADRRRALAEAGALQQLRQGDQALAEALREALEVGPAEPLALDLTAHRANATPNRAIRPRPGSSGVRHRVRPA